MAAPELRLDVRLNLATFRTDLGKAAQAAAAYYYPINLLINKQNLTKQLTAIGRSLGTTKYNIDLNDTSVDIAAGKIDKLAASLKKLSGSIQIDLSAGGGTKPVGTAMKEMAAKLARESKGDINKAVEQMVGMRGASPFGAGTRSIPGFKSAAKGMGVENAFKLFFQELQQVDPQSLKKALDDGSVMMMQENRELKQKFDKIQSSAEGLAQDLRAMGETAKATGKASLTTDGKTLYPQNYGLKIASLLSQVEKLDKDLRNVSGQSGGELLNTLTELSSVLRTTSNSFVGIAGLSENLDQTLRGFDIATKAAANATIAYTERIRRRGGIEYGPSTQKLLPPSSTLSLREMGETMAQRYQAPSRGIKGLLSAGGKTPGEAITEAYIAELRRSFSSRNAIAGLLPPAVGRAPSAYRSSSGESQAELFARRTREAHINSAARAADARQSPLALPPGRERVLGQPPLMTAPLIGESRARPTGMTGAVPRGGPSGDGAGSASLFDAAKKTLQLKTAMDVAAASTKNFTASQIPLVGGIKGLAGEFGQAAKQVLLYGTAYKGLAFLTSLPGQILNAAKSQQQFNNGLTVATQDTGTFAKELLYVDNVQRAFGLNLETTRTGFTRLYASMAPTGFDSGSIEKLFTGISAATASLQLSPDQAGRVTYAFAQIASKGQIMAEEVKGQLGDVLPGALAIFAKSAGMSVKEFSKAMEDGEFVGERFREVFAKVSDELINRFGSGAQAAGRSLQGLINTVGGDFQRTLQSFAPLANSAAQAILGPLGGSLKQLALSAQIATGEIERVFMQLKESQQNLADLRTSAGTDGIITADEARQIKAAEQNVAALTAKYKSLQQAASDPAIAKQAQDIAKFTEELGKAGTFVMNVAQAIGGMLSPVLNFLGTNLTTVISLITSFYIGFQTARLAAMALMGVLLLYRTLSAILGFGPAALGANALAAAFNGLGIAATGAQVKVIGLRLALTALVASTVIGAVVGGIMLIAGAFASMRDRANEAGQSSRDAAKAAVEAAQTGGVAQAAMSVQTILGESRKGTAARKALEGVMARSTKEQRAGQSAMSLTMEESVALKGSPLTEGMVKPAIGGKPQMHIPSKGDAAAIIRQFGSFAGQQDLNLREAKSALTTAQRVAKEIGLDKPTPGVVTPETTGDGAAAGKAAKEKKERESRIPQLTLELEKTKELSAIEMQIVNAQLMNNTSQLNSLELLKQLTEFKYEAKALALEDLTTEERALKYKEIGLRREQAIFENQLQLQIDLKKERDEIQQGFAATLAGYQEEANFQQMYLDLINQGILPSLAKVRVEAEKAFAEGEKKLNQSIEQIEVDVASLELKIEASKLEKNLTSDKQAQLAADEARLKTLKEDLRLRGLLKDTAPERRDAAIAAGERTLAPKTASEYIGEGLEAAQDRLAELTNTGYQVVQAANAIGEAFGEAFKGLITGSMTAQEALAGMFRSIADHFADMVAQMIAEYLKMALIKGLMSIVGGAAGAIGGGLSSGFSAGTSSAIDTGAVGWASSFATPLANFNGGIAPGSFQAFANGGMVTGPTLGLVGEGRYNEAIIPLPDGKSVPVQLSGSSGGNAAPINTSIVVNVKNGQAESQMSGNQGNQLARELEGAVRQVILKESRPGGLISSSR